MREYDRLGLKDYGNEVLAKRAPNSKTFDLGNGQFQLEQTMGIIHYDNNGLDDIDLEPTDMGTYWQIDKAPYIMTVQKATPTISFTDKATGIILNLSLATINNAPVSIQPCVSAPHDEGHMLSFAGALGDGDLNIVCRPAMMHTEQVIRSSNGMKTLNWNISQNSSQPVITETQGSGKDAAGNRPEHKIIRSPLTQNGKLWTGTFQEYLTANILVRDPKTRVQSAVPQVTYPLMVRS